MAIIPDVQDFGNRPIPQDRRSPVTVRNAGAVGEAVSGLGQVMGQVVAKIEEDRDEDNVRRLDVEHAAEARRIRATAREARGLNADAARSTAVQQLAELDTRILGQARSNTARGALSVMVSRRSSLESDSITEYARGETTTAMTTARTARIDSTLDEAEERWETPDAVEESLGTAITEIRSLGQWQGLAPEQVASMEANARSRVRSSVVEQYIQADDFNRANAYLEAHSGEIDHDHEVRLRGLINGELRQQQGESDGAAAIAAGAGHPISAPVVGNGAGTRDAPAADNATPALAPAPARPVSEGDQPGRFRAANGFNIGDGYGARRPGGTHHGMDAGAPAGTPWRVGRSFEVLESHRQTNVRNGRDGGNMARVRIGETEWFAMHLPALVRPGSYGADADVLRSGDSGSATAANPHIHWQPANAAAQTIYNQGRRVTAAFLTGQTGDQAQGNRMPTPDGTRVDIESSYRWIDGQDWTDSRKRRAREAVRAQAGQNDLVRARERSDADEEITTALTRITAGGGRLTSISQLPAAALARASPNTVLQLHEQIRANNQPRAPEANSPLMVNLVNVAANDPARFLRDVQPELLRGRVTDGEVMALTQMRNSIANRDGPQPSTIMGMINFVLPETGLIPTNARSERQGSETEAQARGRLTDAYRSQIFSGVQERLTRNFPHGTQPTEQDVLDAVRAETTVVTINGEQMRYFEARHRGVPIGREQVRIPTDAIPSIDAVLRASGQPTTGGNRIIEYLRHKTRYDAR